MPDGASLARLIDEKMGLKTGSDNLARVTQVAEIRLGRADMIAMVQEALAGFEPDEAIVALTRIPWSAIFTTNYDRGLMRAYELNPTPPRRPVTISEASNLGDLDRRFDVPVFYLHGTLFAGNPTNILITQNDYATFRAVRRMLFENLRTQFAESTFVYIGYSNLDPNWAMLQAEIKAEFGTKPLPHAYRIAPTTDPIDAELLAAIGISTLDGTLADFSAALAAVIEPPGATGVPPDVRVSPSMRKAFCDSPVPILRFENSWEVCNDADFEERPNTASFLRGDRPNWGVISNDLAFKRDAEVDLYDFVVDYITRPDPQRYIGAVLAPAGYGVSTFLMQLAYRVVRDGITRVFRLKPGSEILEADVLFACQTFSDTRNVFIVDNASSAKRQIRATVQLLAQSGLTACFVLGARLNEWRSSTGFVPAREFSIEPLSDAEITALLRLLEAANELGDLRNFEEDARFALVKTRSKQELLVMLREVTEGRQFDAIIEDEYRNIKDELACGLYNLVCALWQEGHYVRDTVASEVLNSDTSALFGLIDGRLNGVVLHDSIDEANGTFGFRARHRTIAVIVWARCLSPDEREATLISTIKNLNLLYSSDRAAFDALIQSDELVDSMPSLEARIVYFESATLSDPRNPYVRQHFARMYLRADRLPSALTQIEQALASDPGIRSLHHTRGLILSRLTRATGAREVARKYFAQAEEEFQHCINVEPRDTYGYVSLAELYREWADRSDDPEESTSYFRKAEETISNGLRRCRVHESLHIESSKVALALGNQPERLAALKRAVDAAVAGGVARYLYGRALRQNGDFAAAADVLEPVFLEDPNAFLPAIELALCRVAATGDFSKGAAVLSQSTLFGLRDARFVATLGGMQFLSKRIEDANQTFGKGKELPAEEQRRLLFRPETRIGDMGFGGVQLSGTIATVGAGYSFVSVPGYLNIFIPSSRVIGRILRPGDAVRFNVAFNALGPVAEVDSLEVISA